MAEADVETGKLRLDGPENARRQTLAEENPECRKCASLEQKRNNSSSQAGEKLPEKRDED